MNNSNFFKENGFIYLRNFIKLNTVENLNYKIQKEKNHKFAKISDVYNNPFIENYKRTTLGLYNYNEEDTNAFPIQGDINDTLHNHKALQNKDIEIIKKIISKAIKNLKLKDYYNWTLRYMTVMIVYPGSPEQEIHYDGNPPSPGTNFDNNDSLYISIPLHDTPLEFGPTILYSDKYIKYKKHKKNQGYLYNANESNKKDYLKARVQEKLNIGDMLIFNHYTLHSSGENKTKKNKEFIFCIIDNLSINEKILDEERVYNERMSHDPFYAFNQSINCTYCKIFLETSKVKKCSRCGTTYCSKKCQIKDWILKDNISHKEKCKSIISQQKFLYGVTYMEQKK
jgi:hypothetical protein